jgi:hypothetical protein
MPIDCSSNRSRQNWYNNYFQAGDDPNEYAEFRILVATVAPLSGVTPSAITFSVRLEYDVEMIAPANLTSTGQLSLTFTPTGNQVVSNAGIMSGLPTLTGFADQDGVIISPAVTEGLAANSPPAMFARVALTGTDPKELVLFPTYTDLQTKTNACIGTGVNFNLGATTITFIGKGYPK